MKTYVALAFTMFGLIFAGGAHAAPIDMAPRTADREVVQPEDGRADPTDRANPNQGSEGHVPSTEASPLPQCPSGTHWVCRSLDKTSAYCECVLTEV